MQNQPRLGALAQPEKMRFLRILREEDLIPLVLLFLVGGHVVSGTGGKLIFNVS